MRVLPRSERRGGTRSNSISATLRAERTARTTSKRSASRSMPIAASAESTFPIAYTQRKSSRRSSSYSCPSPNRKGKDNRRPWQQRKLGCAGFSGNRRVRVFVIFLTSVLSTREVKNAEFVQEEWGKALKYGEKTRKHGAESLHWLLQRSVAANTVHGEHSRSLATRAFAAYPA